MGIGGDKGLGNGGRICLGSGCSVKFAAMITIEDLEEMFSGIRAKTKWNLDGELLWGYFFTDANPKNLERLIQPLTDLDCRYVDIFETEDGSTYFLHVERVEHHTTQTLHAQNQSFEKLADEFCIGSYDGMDVGPAPQP